MAKNLNTVNAETFVTKWMEEVNANGTIESLAAKLNLKPQSVYQRSRTVSETLAAQGVKLPTLRMSGERKKTVDPVKLAELVKSMTKTEVQA